MTKSDYIVTFTMITDEEYKKKRDLLFKDLCPRLHFGVRGTVPVLITLKDYDINGFHEEKEIDTDVELDSIDVSTNEIRVTALNEGIYQTVDEQQDVQPWEITEFKPYLRSWSKMTEDEKKEYRKLCSNCLEQDIVDYNISTLDDSQLIFVIEFLYSHHIDFRGLIERGLALEALENIYN